MLSGNEKDNKCTTMRHLQMDISLALRPPLISPAARQAEEDVGYEQLTCLEDVVESADELHS